MINNTNNSTDRSAAQSHYSSVNYANKPSLKQPKTQIQKYKETQIKFLKSAGGAVTNLIEFRDAGNKEFKTDKHRELMDNMQKRNR